MKADFLKVSTPPVSCDPRLLQTLRNIPAARTHVNVGPRRTIPRGTNPESEYNPAAADESFEPARRLIPLSLLLGMRLIAAEESSYV